MAEGAARPVDSRHASISVSAPIGRASRARSPPLRGPSRPRPHLPLRARRRVRRGAARARPRTADGRGGDGRPGRGGRRRLPCPHGLRCDLGGHRGSGARGTPGGGSRPARRRPIGAASRGAPGTPEPAASEGLASGKPVRPPPPLLAVVRPRSSIIAHGGLYAHLPVAHLRAHRHGGARGVRAATKRSLPAARQLRVRLLRYVRERLTLVLRGALHPFRGVRDAPRARRGRDRRDGPLRVHRVRLHRRSAEVRAPGRDRRPGLVEDGVRDGPVDGLDAYAALAALRHPDRRPRPR